MSKTPSSPACPNCQARIEDRWSVCPFCGLVLPPPEPKTLPPSSPPIYIGPEAESQKDLGKTGVGLIAIGILGFLGGVSLLFSDAAERASPDALVSIIVIVGGGMIALVVTGTTLATGNAMRRAPGLGVATGLLGGFAAAMMGLVMGAVLFVAMVIAMLASCNEACSNSHAARPQLDATAQLDGEP